jgi:copper(I)-binding protein
MNRFIIASCIALFSMSAFAGNLALSNAWIRYLPAGVPAAGYFTLSNHGDHPVTLKGVRSAAFSMVMLHRSVQENGVSKMLPVDSVEVPAGGTLEFKPGGYHLMLMSPTSKITPGDEIPLTLEFTDDETLTGNFAVRGPAGNMNDMGGMNGMNGMSGMHHPH